jgi:hypothetical protein
MHPHRGWTLIRDGEVITQEEAAHLECCPGCNDWLAGFMTLARKAGFPISFEIPACKFPRGLKATHKRTERIATR